MRIFQAFGAFFKILGSKDFARSVKNICAVNPKQISSQQQAALQLLNVLQREGRFVDFMMEDIENVSDEQVGAAVRSIHKGCSKALAEYFVIKPIVEQAEESAMKFEKNSDVSKINFIGNVSDKMPDKGILKHHGWEVSQVLLPEIADGRDINIICPAEVEI